jgi:citrate synthase
MREVVPEREDYIRKVYAATKDEQLSTVTVQQAFQGMRGVKALVCDTSELDVEDGIRFRGLTVHEVRDQLPTAQCRSLPGLYPLPEAMLWLLLTGDVPTDDETKQLSEELTSEPFIHVPKRVRHILDSLPEHQHPMSQFITGILAMQPESKFAEAYANGVHRTKLWKYSLDDSMRLIAKIPQITSRIYRQTFSDGYVLPAHSNLDWSANWCEMIGFDSAEFQDLMRLYFTIHTDHEGGNVSAHATKLVGSALSDPYLSYAAGMCGLAGPLHGLANQESLRFILGLKKILDASGHKCTKPFLETHVKELLSSGQVIPGFGHAVLRVTDPRYTIQREFALKHMPDSELFGIVSMLYEVVPPILKTWRGGKVANPWPNLDAHSGCLLYEYGFTHESFYTVLFGMSRSIGVLSQFITDRYILAPIERPKSISVKSIAEQFKVQIP